MYFGGPRLQWLMVIAVIHFPSMLARLALMLFFFLIVIYLFIYFCNNMRTTLAWLKNKEELVLGP